MNRLRSAVLRRCKSLPRVAVGARPSPAPYSNLRSMSTRDDAAAADDDDDDGLPLSDKALLLVLPSPSFTTADLSITDKRYADIDKAIFKK